MSLERERERESADRAKPISAKLKRKVDVVTLRIDAVSINVIFNENFIENCLISGGGKVYFIQPSFDGWHKPVIIIAIYFQMYRGDFEPQLLENLFFKYVN